MIRIENLTQKYGGTQILWGLDLELKKGQCSCIMGRNGVSCTPRYWLCASRARYIPIAQRGREPIDWFTVSK